MNQKQLKNLFKAETQERLIVDHILKIGFILNTEFQDLFVLSYGKVLSRVRAKLNLHGIDIRPRLLRKTNKNRDINFYTFSKLKEMK